MDLKDLSESISVYADNGTGTYLYNVIMIVTINIHCYTIIVALFGHG